MFQKEEEGDWTKVRVKRSKAHRDHEKAQQICQEGKASTTYIKDIY